MNKILFRLWGLPPSISVRVPNGRRLQEGLKVPFPAGWIFRQRDFLLIQAKHMLLSVIFRINPVSSIEIIEYPAGWFFHRILNESVEF